MILFEHLIISCIQQQILLLPHTSHSLRVVQFDEWVLFGYAVLLCRLD